MLKDLFFKRFLKQFISILNLFKFPLFIKYIYKYFIIRQYCEIIRIDYLAIMVGQPIKGSRR